MRLDVETALEFACATARVAGREILQHYDTAVVGAKAGGSPVTSADHASNEIIVDALRSRFADHAVLSEESKDSAARETARYVWIVDPLDGTKEFISKNGEFSVMIALVEDGDVKLGVVYKPVGDVLYYAASGHGAFRSNGDVRRLELDAGPRDKVRMVGSRSHADPAVQALAERLGARITPCGSVGLKCALIAEGASDLYVHPVSYISEWDTAAPEILLREAGGTVSGCDGQRLRYNKRDPRQHDGILAAAPGLEARTRAILDEIRAQ